MVLRKPYGFLIKHFKKIHLAILFLLCFLIYKTKGFLDFLNLYIDNGYTTNQTSFASTYFNLGIFLIFAITIASLVAICFLMLSKKKNSKYYIISIVFYSALLILFFFGYNLLVDLEYTTKEASVIRVYHDIFNIAYYPQFIFIIFTLLRGIGFDIKSFNFNKDLEDLDLLDEDNEEVEVNIDLSGYKAKRNTRRSLREFRYYVLENRFVFTCLAILAGIVAIVSLILNFQVYNKRYKLQEQFVLNNFNISYKDSILTNRDYQGNIITEGKYYLATVVHIKNLTSNATKFDTSALKLVIGNEVIYPVLDRGDRFADIGVPYKAENILGETEKDYVFVYELTEEQIKKEYQIKILSSVELGKKELIPRYKIIKLEPRVYDKVKTQDSNELNEVLNFQQTNLLDTTYQVKDYLISNKYEYSYDYCYLGTCYPSKNILILDQREYYNQTLLVLKDELNLDPDAFYTTDRTTTHNFYIDFVKVKYTIDDETYTASVTDMTPKRVTNRTVLRTTANIEKADSINLEIHFRDQIYSIKLK